MGRKTLSVSLEADRNYVRALGILADKEEKTIGKLTRDAIDSIYGPDLKRLVSFFSQNDLQKDHSISKKSKRTGAGG